MGRTKICTINALLVTIMMSDYDLMHVRAGLASDPLLSLLSRSPRIMSSVRARRERQLFIEHLDYIMQLRTSARWAEPFSLPLLAGGSSGS
jgi:hypothetical protein